jgi:hypothetical protein
MIDLVSVFFFTAFKFLGGGRNGHENSRREGYGCFSVTICVVNDFLENLKSSEQGSGY